MLACWLRVHAYPIILTILVTFFDAILHVGPARAQEFSPGQAGRSALMRTELSAPQGGAAGGEAGGEGTNPDGSGSTEPGLAAPSAGGGGANGVSLPSGAGTPLGMGESFSAQLSTGTSNFNVPIALPAARGRVQPQLFASYSSGAGAGLAGMGWSIGASAIARQTDRGTPRYDDRSDYHVGQDRFSFAGGELVPICRVGSSSECAGARAGEVFPAWSRGWQYFRARVEGGYLRFFWSPDHRSWRVQVRDGTQMEFGVPLDGSGYDGALERNPARPQQISRWGLVRQYDAAGSADTAAPAPVNVIAYRYLRDGDQLYLSDIYDTPPASAPTTAAVNTWANHARLIYDLRPDAVIGYRAGFAQEQRLRVVRVDIASKPFTGGVSAQRTMLRRYHFSYDASAHTSLLSELRMEGRCAAQVAEQSDESLPATACPSLPAMRFGYQHVPNGAPPLLDSQGYAFEALHDAVETVQGSPNRSLDAESTVLADLDADGLVDLYVTDPARNEGKHTVYFGAPGSSADLAAFSPAREVSVTGAGSVNEGVLTLGNVNVSALDFDGDGKLNLIHAPNRGRYDMFDFVANGSQLSWTRRAPAAGGAAAPSQPNIDFSRDRADARVMDVNGDGLVDIVVSSATDIRTFFALGRHPNGEGRFGSVNWGRSGELSNDPEVRCAPWSATPARFSDADIVVAEMNGDGLPDIVRLRSGQVLYWPGRGDGFWGTGARDDCRRGAFAVDRHIEVSNPPRFGTVTRGRLLLADVNGDALADLVEVRAAEVDVYLNDGGHAFTERHTLENTPFVSGSAASVQLVDVNGSGSADLLWGRARDYQLVDLMGGVRPHLLTQIENGFGQTIHLEYESTANLMKQAARLGTPWRHRSPAAAHVLTRSVVRDNLERIGRPGGFYETFYSYRDPYYSGPQRAFRGFRQVTTRVPGDANSPTNLSRASFLVGDCWDEGETSCAPESPDGDDGRGALAGLGTSIEQFDEAGVFLSSTHTTHTVRQLYTGLDGRRVVHAFPTQTDTWLYDTATFAPDERDVTIPSLVLELADRTGVESATIVTRASQGTARLRTRRSQDGFGNTTESIRDGCIEGCPAGIDEGVITHSDFALPAGDLSGWRYREIGSYTRGTANARRFSELTQVHDAAGNLVETRALLSGTLPLSRTHSAGGAVAPAPAGASGGASAPAQVLVAEYDYDQFGNITLTVGASGRCARSVYDTMYASLVTSSQVHVGSVGADGCGSRVLARSFGYDRGFGSVLDTTSPAGEPSRYTYDGFGRTSSVTLPDAARPGMLGEQPSVIYEYDLPAAGSGRPYSAVVTHVQDGATTASGAYHESWSFVDGSGRTIASLSEADPTAGDAGDYVLSSVVGYDRKGGVQRAFEPVFWSGTASQLLAAPLPASASASMRYDAFARPVSSTDLLERLESRSDYHALSTDVFDAEDVEPGPRQGTYSTQVSDGHARTRRTINRIGVGGSIEEHGTLVEYLPTGLPLRITQRRAGSSDVVRWMAYDSLGRMVLNAEPNTSVSFGADFSAPPAQMRSWRYAYNDAGDLVGTSDARGCGANTHYDMGGRIVAVDYSPCGPEQPAYTAPNLATGNGTEAFYRYDLAEADSSSIVDAAGRAFSADAARYIGRLTSVSDRGVRLVMRYDGRGQVSGTAVRLARPGAPNADLGARYAPRWYTRATSFDAAGRAVMMETGATVADLMGAGGRSEVTYQHSGRGLLKSVAGSYGTLVANALYEADGQTTAITFGDAAATERSYGYDQLRRLETVQTYRGPPGFWSQPGGTSYVPPAAGSPPNRQEILEDLEFRYDRVSNLTGILDHRDPALWPAAAKPVNRTFAYDDLGRLTNTTYAYAGGADSWQSPYAAENAGGAGPKPSPHVQFAQRVTQQTARYDHLGNIVESGDDAQGFFDRSLGVQTHDTAAQGPHRLVRATNRASAPSSPQRGDLDVLYDAAGNVRALIVRRDGTCLPTGASCWQRFGYEWDEVGRLSRAQRWDLTPAERTTNAATTSPAPARQADVALTYTYDIGGNRTHKLVNAPSQVQRTTAYVFPSLELRSTTWDGTDYLVDRTTADVRLYGAGLVNGRVMYATQNLPSVDTGRLHVFLDISDHIDSRSLVVDRETSELVELTTYQSYGATESDYRPGRWASYREPYHFGGKEEDIEVGLGYFGARYYSAYLQRWMSPDPIAIHKLGSDPNPYAYVHGSPLMTLDPSGEYGIAFAAAGVVYLMYVIVIAVVVSTLVSVAVNVATQLAMHPGRFDWGLQGLGGAALMGAASGLVGGIVGIVAGPLAGAAAGGMAGGVVNNLAQNAGQGVDWGDVALDGTIGAGLGVAGYGVGMGLSKGWQALRGAAAAPRTSGSAPHGTTPAGLPNGPSAAGTGAGKAGQAASSADEAAAAAGDVGAAPNTPPPATTVGANPGAARHARAKPTSPKQVSPTVQQVQQTPRMDTCFPAGTSVATPDGPASIEDVGVGASVWALDLATGSVQPAVVTATYEREVRELVAVETARGVIWATRDHPFWVEHLGWVEAASLTGGMNLRTRDGDGNPVRSATLVHLGSVTVYNLEVEGAHNYFVGDAQLLVHNATPGYRAGTPDVTPRSPTVADRLKGELLERQGRDKGRTTLEAARRELAGENTGYDHVTKVRQAQRGLVNRIEAINRQLGYPGTTPEQRAVLQTELSETSRLLDYSEGFVPR